VKFVEKDYEKIITLFKIRDEFISKLARIDVELAGEVMDPDETPEERRQRWYLRKVEGGGFVIQLCAMLMAWLCVEDGGMKKFIDEKVGLDDIRETIRGMSFVTELTVEQLKNVEEPDEEEEPAELANAAEEKDIMEVLIDVLGEQSGVNPAIEAQ
jgi:beta-catenin-like protein 1